MSESKEMEVNLDSLKVNQNFTDMMQAERKIISCQVRKPKKQEWIRAHSNSDYQANLGLMEFGEEREIYAVSNDLIGSVDDIYIAKVVAAINRQGTVFLWPAKQPMDGNRVMEWHRTAMIAQAEASKGWVNVRANRDSQSYDVRKPKIEFPELEWPTIDFEELIKLGFKDHYINDHNHPVLKQIRGEQ